MATGLPRAVLSMTRHLLELASRDDQFRADIHALAEAVFKATAPARVAVEADRRVQNQLQTQLLKPTRGLESRLIPEPRQPHERDRDRDPLREPGVPLGELTLGQQSRPREQDPRFDAMVAASDDEAALLDVVTRCRMKAEGARWAAIRFTKIQEGVDFRVEVAPRDREVIEKAGAIPGCFLWTNTASFRPPEDLDLMEELAECFEVMAEAVILVLRLLDGSRSKRVLLAQGLDLLAETQSALRVAILRVGGSSDSDQFKVYQWIRQVANVEGHFIHRYMKLEDPAEPTRAPWTRAQIGQMMSGFEQEGQRGRKREERLKTLRFHASRLGKTDGDRYHWQKIVQTVHEMVIVDQIPPSSVDIRDALVPVWDLLPDFDDPPTGFNLAIREIDRYLEVQNAPAYSPPEEPRDLTSPEIREVANLLSGRAVLMIGGMRQPHAQTALTQAFNLSELVWFDAKEHGSNEFFRPSIARADVALVLLAIRWSSHSFGDVKADCDRLGKPLVRLPAGYNPQQVASQILAQCSDQLRQLGED